MLFRYSFSELHPLTFWGDCITRQLGVASFQHAAGDLHVASMNINDAARQLRDFEAACTQYDVAGLLGSLHDARGGASR